MYIYNIVNLLKSYDNIHSMTYITKIMVDYCIANQKDKVEIQRVRGFIVDGKHKKI